MASITRILTKPTAWADVWIATWPNMGGADVGTPAEMPMASDKSIQVSGTFAGATVSIQGSNDGLNYYTLTDPQGVALTFVIAGLRAIIEHTRHLKVITSGGAASDITVTAFMRGQIG